MQISGSGALNIGAVDLFANDASSVYYDDLSLAAPVQPVACDAPADIPWASVNPTNGTTPGGGSTPVTVTFNSTGLANGTYTGNLCVTSNDPDPGPGNGTDLVIVPLTLTVQPPTAVTLSGLTAHASQSPVPGRRAAGCAARSRRPGNGRRLRTAAQALITVPQTSEVFRSRPRRSMPVPEERSSLGRLDLSCTSAVFASFRLCVTLWRDSHTRSLIKRRARGSASLLHPTKELSMTFTRSAGVLLHPTSFPSRYGIGDLGEAAYRFVDFLEGAGQTLWQVLPLGPTGYGDSPYQCFSAFAGNPMLIDPEQLIGAGLLSWDELNWELPDFPA